MNDNLFLAYRVFLFFCFFVFCFLFFFGVCRYNFGQSLVAGNIVFLPPRVQAKLQKNRGNDDAVGRKFYPTALSCRTVKVRALERVTVSKYFKVIGDEEIDRKSPI